MNKEMELSDIDNWYRKYCKKEYQEFKNGFFPIRAFDESSFGYGDTVTWCPVCDRQAFVSFISFAWVYHMKCGCTFSKEVV